MMTMTSVFTGRTATYKRTRWTADYPVITRRFIGIQCRGQATRLIAASSTTSGSSSRQLPACRRRRRCLTPATFPTRRRGTRRSRDHGSAAAVSGSVDRVRCRCVRQESDEYKTGPRDIRPTPVARHQPPTTTHSALDDSATCSTVSHLQSTQVL